MSINWKFWKKKSFEEKCNDLQTKLMSVPTMYANSFNKVGIFEHFMLGGARMKDGQICEFESPKILYGWLDPKSGMEYNNGWILGCIKGHFFELKVSERVSDNKVKVDSQQSAFSLKELIERVELGDYDEMMNEDTDKSVTEELKEVIKKHNLKPII